MTIKTKGIFLCHAGEDKEHIARPLAQKLEANGISCRFDEAMVHWGESIVSKVNEGLASSMFVIVVLSQAFIQKNWPQRELNSRRHRVWSWAENAHEPHLWFPDPK